MVINEIFYHAPNDWDHLQWIELHNAGSEMADISGWTFSKAVKLTFPAGTKIEAGGYLVISRDTEVFRRFYTTAVAKFTFDEDIRHKGARIELRDAKDDLVDLVKFSHEAPWPLTPDGESSSLERISPGISGDNVYNWAPSPPTVNYETPGGTPGSRNSAYSASLPPVIESAALSADTVEPKTALSVQAKVLDADKVAKVMAVYRVGGGGRETPESTIEMTAKPNGLFTAEIPGQEAGKMIHVRVVAVGKDKTQRSFPSENDLRPALSCWVRQPLTESKLTQFVVVQSQPGAPAQQPEQNQPSEDDMRRWQQKAQLRTRYDMASLWSSLTLTNDLPSGQLAKLQGVFRDAYNDRVGLARRLDEADEAPTSIEFDSSIDSAIRRFAEKLSPLLVDAQKPVFESWRKQAMAHTALQSSQWILRYTLNVEDAFMKMSVLGDEDEGNFVADRIVFQGLVGKLATLAAQMAGSDFNQEYQKRQPTINALRAELRQVINRLPPNKRTAASTADPAMAFQMHPKKAGGGSKRERTALIVIEPGSQKTTVYDFVRMVPRKAGWKIHLPKEADYRGMTTLNVIFEFNDRFVIAEPLAFEIYRRAGNEASLTDFVRLTMDGQPMGYHLLCEQPNKGFLRRAGLRDDGNLYKVDWHGNDLVSHHEKKTHVQEGFDDLIKVVSQLNKTKGEAQWTVIRDNFDVHQVATYFAVNTVLAHWDGYFNNQFIYHDIHGSGKWTMYPWDQDKAMGFYDNLRPGGVFADMPLTFGMKGDVPPNWNRSTPPTSFMETMGIPGSEWWREPGYFSGPLLANPQFRACYLARVKELLNSEFGEAPMMEAINTAESRLKDEVRVRAQSRGEDPAHPERVFRANIDSLRRFVKARREYLLAQPELQKAQPVDWTKL